MRSARRAALLLGLLAVAACGSGAAARSGSDSAPLSRLSPILEDVGGSPYPGQQPLQSVGPGTFKVPILMYHYIRDNPTPADPLSTSLSVSPEHFTQQMDWLQSNGYIPITFNDLLAYRSNQRPPPAHPVILTFDDGYADFFSTALPILRAHRFAAVAYIVTGFLNRPGYMTADQVVQVDRAGVQIGSHTVNHIDLTHAGPDQLRHELVDSRSQLERLVRHRVVDFCYPSGRFNDPVVRAVQAAGYRDATTTAPGVVHSGADRFTWTRVRVSGTESIDDFARALA